MSSASPQLPAATPRRRKFGTYSLVLAVLAFAVFTAKFGGFMHVPRNSGFEYLAQWLAIISLLGLVTLMELVGAVLGVTALFRSGDHKILGLLGAVLNLFLLVSGLNLALLMIAQTGVPRP